MTQINREDLVLALLDIGIVANHSKNAGTFEITSNGSIRFNDGATVWEDIQNSLIGKQLSSTAGKVDYNWTENTITFNSGGSIETANDIVNWNQQFPHAAKVNSKLRPHIHFEQVSTNKIIFTLKYRIQKNGQAKTTAWTTVTCNTDDNAIFSYSSGTLNQILHFPAIDMLNAGISATVQFQMTRTDSTAGDIEVTFVDCHAEFDSLGSSEEYNK